MVTALLVTTAATLMESAPFILAAAVIARTPLRRSSWMVPYLGCGCGTGPSARSLPAAAATYMVFGPAVACARFGAALFAGRIVRRRHACSHPEPSALDQLWLLIGPAATGSVISMFAATLVGPHVPAAKAFAGGAIAAFLIAPCGLGAMGLAASLRGTLPAASVGFLCVAGIADLRTWLRAPHRHCRHDALAYAIAALAFAIVAARGGAGLVHPRIAFALWFCAVACCALAYRHRAKRSARMRIAPAIMFAGAVLSAPLPQYHATETSLTDAFAGEHVDFTGMVTHTGDATTLVRYAITCCRADAAPVVIRLAKDTPSLRGWARAKGVLVQNAGGLRLHADLLQRIAAPADPFVYR